MPIPGDVIVLESPRLKKLGGELSDLLDDREAAWQRRFQDIRTHRDWYDAKPRTERKSWPWPMASNIVVPLIQAHSDSLIARLWGGMHRFKDLWQLTSENERFASLYLNDVQRFMNYAGRNEFDTFWSTWDWISEFVPIGESVLALGWDERREWLYLPGDLRRQGSRARPRHVVTQRGPVWEHVPREQLLSDWGVPISESEMYARQFFLSWTALVQAAQQSNGYDMEAVQSVKGQVSEQSPAWQARRDKQLREGYDETTLQGLPYDVREVGITWPMLTAMGLRDEDIRVSSAGEVIRPELADAKVPHFPLVATLHRESRTVLRLIAKPYAIRGWPFLELQYRKRPGAGALGTAKQLEMLQRAISTMLNQAIDGVTLANTINMKTTDASLKSGVRFSPNEPIYLRGSIDDLQPLQLSKGILPDIALINLVNTFAERISGATDPLLGRESRSGGHPSPATNFLGMLEESGKLMFPAVLQLRHQLSKAGELTATLYQQFEMNEGGRIQRIFGEKDAQGIQEFLFPNDLTFAGNTTFDVRALSEVMNPQAKAARALAVDQVTTNYFGFLFQVVPVLSDPQVDPLTRKTVLRAIEARTKSVSGFLEASEVDEVEDYLVQLRESQLGNANVLNQFAGFLRDVGAGAGPDGQQPMGRPNGGAQVAEGPGSGFAV